MLNHFKRLLLGSSIMSLSIVQAADCLTADILSDQLLPLMNDGRLSFDNKSYEINPHPTGIENLEHQIQNTSDLKLIFPNAKTDGLWIEKIEADGGCRFAVARKWSNPSRQGLMGAPMNVTGGFLDLKEVLDSDSGSSTSLENSITFIPIEKKANFTLSPRYRPKSLLDLLESGS